jgi:N-acetylmuramic acid 6-phosphate etherase
MQEFIRITEQPSPYRHQEKMSVKEIITHINDEDKTVAFAVEKALPQIEELIIAVADKMLNGGRLFYVGAGTSGRLGILDASECPPTYGVPFDLITGIIAGGKDAIIRSIEDAEDDRMQGWHDLQKHYISEKDFVIGIAASGTTPYVVGTLRQCQLHGIETGCIVCNVNSPLGGVSNYPVEVIAGPEFVTGSTRMKSGTAQKLILNMISTTVMIQLGRVEDNRMVNMQLNNEKLRDRGFKMLMEKINLQDYDEAKTLLEKFGSVKKAADAFKKK